VDVLQISVLEFTDRPGSPLFHLEHFIDGQYIKYNSNSGFVEESLRLTPQVRALDIDCSWVILYVSTKFTNLLMFSKISSSPFQLQLSPGL